MTNKPKQTKSKFKRKTKDIKDNNPVITIKRKRKRKRKSPKRKDKLKTANIIERTIKRKKASSYHIANRAQKNKGGRQDKLTPQIQKKLLKAIRSGMRLNRAFKFAGISNVTYYNWIESGRTEADRIRKEVEIQRKAAIKMEELNPWKVEENENWIDNKINELQPNKYFNFLIAVERHNAMSEMDNLDAILNARDGGQYLAEIIIEKDKNGKIIKETEIKKYMRPSLDAAKWMLKKTQPGIYADRQILAHEGEIQNNQTHEHNHTITIDESPDNIAGVLGLLIQTGFIQGKLIEHSEPKPGIKQITATKNN